MHVPLVMRQTWALTKKNTIILTRSWISTPLRSLIIPILLATLLLKLPEITHDRNTYGVATPAPLRSLAESMNRTNKKLAIIESPGLGPDFADVLERITEPVGSDKVIRLGSEDEVAEACSVDFFGRSEYCHAILIFHDSPLSGHGRNARWNYTLKVDPSRTNSPFNVFDRDNDIEGFYLPIQVAVENAMAGSSGGVPETFTYAVVDEQTAEAKKEMFLSLALYILSFVFFATMASVTQHVSSMVAKERESGMAQLVDAMTGGIPWSRILSYVVTFDILYLPVWAILGLLFWSQLVPTQSIAAPLFWQILTGWAVTNASIFGATFFKRSNLGSIVVFGVSFLLAVLATHAENKEEPLSLGAIVILALLFPPMNYVFFFDCMLKWELTGKRMDAGNPIPADALDSGISGQSGQNNWVNQSGSFFLWIILFVQIVGYPLLAILVEKCFHGNNRKHRDFNTSSEAQNSHVAIETTELKKHYKPSIWKKIFCCCARQPSVKAVDGLGLVIQKQQILCLLGPNGSGKTTTLEMMAGFHAPTEGSIKINAPSSQIGICPQKNVFWSKLTVKEHLVLWSSIKGGADTPESLEGLITKCDLAHKKSCLVRNLSGGMKRKLQLACMLVGGSSVCLMDEVTSGLDPLSRRVIWNAILGERARRTMVLTTHFLDECEVLSDHIVILSLGKLKCQGSPAELKNQYGGGYRVHVPKTEDISHISYPVTDHGDRFVCTTPDSSAAAKLLSTLKDTKDSEMFITGPTVEDVFLKVSDDSAAHNEGVENNDIVAKQPNPNQAEADEPEITTTRMAIFLRQFRALFLKRLTVLRSQWWAYLLAIAIPIVACHLIGPFLEKYKAPSCSGLVGQASRANVAKVDHSSDLVVAPPSASDIIVNMVEDSSHYATDLYSDPTPILEPNRDAWLQYFHDNKDAWYGGVFIDNATAPLVAIPAQSYAAATKALALMNVVNNVRTKVPITVNVGYIQSLNAYAAGNSVIWVTMFCLLQALYPAFFALYPTYEKRSNVRALQYSNGIRAPYLWLSYMAFDFIWVLVVALLCTVIIAPQAEFWGLGYMFITLALYGVAAMLVSYIISIFATSQPAAFTLAILVMMVEYVVSLVSISIQPPSDQGAQDGVTYGLGLVFPVENVMRAAALSLNQYIVRCRGREEITDPGSIYAYGGPILLLVIQIFAFFGLLLWLDGTVFTFSRTKALPQDEEKNAASGRPDVDAETARVAASQDNLLRLVHVEKKFGQTTAVDDVSLGLREGEILALLGPNGAGKTTTINMVRGDLRPTAGAIFLKGLDVQKNTRAAQRYLGVCPQFNALDMLTVREHLVFYARCKGVRDITADVENVMASVGISAHAKKLAARLSGGNKRKLSLAISLLGNPPVLLLDEPSSAMDAASKRTLWKTLLRTVSPGRSVVITTHSMEEADALATRAAIIARRLLAIGSTQELRKAHNNEYHVHLILKSAPLSTAGEMQDLADWVRETFPHVQFEGENLGGQVRFIVPADSEVTVSGDISMVRYLIETLEGSKGVLGLECYSIGAATMERVFLSVVKESDAVEWEEATKPFWRRFRLGGS